MSLSGEDERRYHLTAIYGKTNGVPQQLEENPVPQIPGRGFLQLEHRTSQEMPRLECSASSSALCSAEGTPEIPSATETAPGPDRVGKGPRRLRLSKGAIAGIAIGGGVGLGLILAPVFYFRNCSRRLSRTRMRMRMRKRGRDDGEETPSPSIKPEADSTQDIQLAVPAPLRPSRSPPAPSPASQSSRVPIGGPSKKSLTRRQHRPRTPSPLVPPPLAKAAISGGNRDKELPALPLEHHDDRRLTLPR